MVNRFLKHLEQQRVDEYALRHVEQLPAIPGTYRNLNPPLPDALLGGLKALGIERLYSHQADAITAVRNRDNVVVVTPTASGKSLTYLLPLFESLLKNPEQSALLLFPLKALEQDQYKKIKWWCQRLSKDAKITAEIYDGDTPQHLRRKIKAAPPNLLITNPDMLHQGILAYHQGWEKFLRRLKFIVIDELHAYRGVFGSHFLQVLKRLLRLCAFYEVDPRFICLSATIANPLELAETLSGHSFRLISDSGAPVGARRFGFVDTNLSISSTAAKLFIDAVDYGLKTIVFAKARVTTEIIYRTVVDRRPDLNGKISSYRAGFLPQERREIEKLLISGELDGVVSTSALELGIDIGGLDLCILVGYPGSIMSTWQRAGRVGRRGMDSAILLVAGSDALDQYLLANPGEFFAKSYERALVNDRNEEILRKHLPAAAGEIPLMQEDPFLDIDAYRDVIRLLEHEGKLVKSASGQQWFPGVPRPQQAVDLRSVGGTFDIVCRDTNESIGQISGGAVFRECHDGAIYLHRGQQYQVESLDLEQKKITAYPVTAAVYTMVRSDKQTEIIDDRRQKQVRSFVAHAGKIRVTETFHSYERRRLYTQELLSVEPLDLPPQNYVTDGVWIDIPEAAVKGTAERELHVMGGIHALEHAMISLIPLFALCDRSDVGGISFTHHVQLPGAAVFLYDGHPGGAGIAEYVYNIIEQLLERTLTLIRACPCLEGCPSCIHSPRCGSGNKPLDKQAVLYIAEQMLEDPVEPPEIVCAKDVDLKAEAEAEEVSIEPYVPQTVPDDLRLVVFDLETRKSAEEVGGWSEIRQMRVAVGVVWDSLENRMFVYDEAAVSDLIDHLKRADVVVGYNVNRFDYEVLRGYTFENLNRLPTIDLLLEVQSAAGLRLKLDTLVKATLGTAKTADGLQSLKWFREGKLDLVKEYCIKDVELTRDLLLFVLKNGYLTYQRKDFGSVRVPLKLDLSRFRKTTAVTFS